MLTLESTALDFFMRMDDRGVIFFRQIRPDFWQRTVSQSLLLDTLRFDVGQTIDFTLFFPFRSF